jgi:hypothetical protein
MLVDVVLLFIPLVLVALASLLFMTEVLERRSADVVVSMAIRSPWSSPEVTERLVTAEMARRLEAAGLAERP